MQRLPRAMHMRCAPPEPECGCFCPCAPWHMTRSRQVYRLSVAGRPAVPTSGTPSAGARASVCPGGRVGARTLPRGFTFAANWGPPSCVSDNTKPTTRGSVHRKSPAVDCLLVGAGQVGCAGHVPAAPGTPSMEPSRGCWLFLTCVYCAYSLCLCGGFHCRQHAQQHKRSMAAVSAPGAGTDFSKPLPPFPHVRKPPP